MVNTTTRGQLYQNEDFTYSIATLLNEVQATDAAVANQAAGIPIMKCCYASGSVDGKTQVSLASISDPTHIPAFGISAAAVNDEEDIRMVRGGFAVIDTDANILGAVVPLQKVYLGENGDIVTKPTTSINGNLQIGTVLITGSSGLIFINIIPFVLGDSLEGVLRYIIENTNPAPGAAAAHTAVNDIKAFASFGVASSNAPGVVESALVIFNSGGGDSLNSINASDKVWRWRNDQGGGFADMMTLLSDGELKLPGKGIFGGKEVTEDPDPETDFWKIFSDDSNIFKFMDGDGVIHLMADRPFASHDRQKVDVAGPVVLPTSGVFTPIPGATITTKDLGEAGKYVGTMVMEVEHSSNNSVIEIRMCVNGVPQETKEFHIGAASKDQPAIVVAVGEGSGVEAESEITAEWKTDKDSATLNSLTLIVDGVPDSAVVT
ncbi:MAG: hypothetical protein V3T43_06125 [Nitrosomonadaceae bacterium]